jgi:hypothetical protein
VSGSACRSPTAERRSWRTSTGEFASRLAAVRHRIGAVTTPGSARTSPLRGWPRAARLRAVGAFRGVAKPRYVGAALGDCALLGERLAAEISPPCGPVRSPPSTIAPLEPDTAPPSSDSSSSASRRTDRGRRRASDQHRWTASAVAPSLASRGPLSAAVPRPLKGFSECRAAPTCVWFGRLTLSGAPSTSRSNSPAFASAGDALRSTRRQP